MATKTQYTAAQEDSIINAIEGVETYAEQREVLEELSVSMGKNMRSLTAKVSSLHKAGKCEFIKKEYTREKGETKPAEKAVIVGFIADLIGENVELLETLEKANKNALIKVFNYINNQVLELEADEVEQAEMEAGA